MAWLSAVKKLANGDPALGTSYGYTFDDIGNRKTATANFQVSSYAANTKNQYSSRTVPAIAEALGTAAADAVVTVNDQPAQRQGTGWYLSLPYANAYEPTWVDLKMKGVRTGAGPGGIDAVATGTRHVWLPKSPEAYTYDADGNLAADGRWSYTWDAENRLSACETRSDLLPPNGPFPLAQRQRLEFSYDGAGRRVSKKVSNWNGSNWVLASSKLFLYDGWNLLADLNALNNSAVVCTYAWGLDMSGSLQGAGGVGGLLFTTLHSSQATIHSACYDGNGNVIGLVDMATGTKSATYDYNAFGETIQSDGVAAVENHFRFSTKYTDDETGLLYYGFRYYNPQTGRWLNRDQIAERGGMNLYEFSKNRPIVYLDPLGESVESRVIDGGNMAPIVTNKIITNGLTGWNTTTPTITFQEPAKGCNCVKLKDVSLVVNVTYSYATPEARIHELHHVSIDVNLASKLNKDIELLKIGSWKSKQCLTEILESYMAYRSADTNFENNIWDFHDQKDPGLRAQYSNQADAARQLASQLGAQIVEKIKNCGCSKN